MRTLTLSLILGFTLFLSGVSMAGSTDSLPNAGLFAFSNPPMVFTVPQAMIVASR